VAEPRVDEAPSRSLLWTIIHVVLTLRDYAVKAWLRLIYRPFRRARKLTRDRLRAVAVAVRVEVVRWWRWGQAVPRRSARRVHVWSDTVKELRTYGTEWAVEREIGRVVSGDGPIIVGPWLSEVGYEVLYWVPFVRWVQSHYGIKSSRLTVVTRGGAAAWYRDITEQSVEIFDLVTPQEFTDGNSRRAAETRGSLKQWAMTSVDRSLVTAAAARAGLEDVRVLHPSHMYRLFEQFMLGHRHADFFRRHTIVRRIECPAVKLPALPSEYVAVKFYTAASLPDSAQMRVTLQNLVRALADRWPVVLLDTAFALDEHDDYGFDPLSRVMSLKDVLQPRDNLAVQSAVIANAAAFVGTCGSLAWLAPMLGVNTTALFADPQFLHGHLQVGRQIYQNLGAGQFSPLDLSALDSLGLTLVSRERRHEYS
jgi:hypothetical protein